MRLLSLAPTIQEALLFLPQTTSGRDPIHLQQLLSVTAVLDWRQQFGLWKALQEKTSAITSPHLPCQSKNHEAGLFGSERC
jgi:hypothetical protein